MNHSSGTPGDGGDADIARAVRLASRLPAIPDDRRAAAYQRVRAEWQAATAPPATRRSTGWRAALAAGIAASLVAVALVVGRVDAPAGAEVAVAWVGQGVEVAPAARQPWQFWGNSARELRSGAVLHRDDVLQTGGQGAALLRVGPLLTLRLAPQSQLRLDAVDRVTLLRGQVYIDSGSPAGDAGQPLTVATAAGDVRHLGTRYLVRAGDNVVEVAVRDGRVLLAGRNATVRTQAGAGEGLRLVADASAVERYPLSPDDASYAWLAQIPTPLEIEGQTLGTFLDWYAAETGRPVAMGTGEPAERMRAVRLSGSIAGLTPDQALDTVAAVADLAIERRGDQVKVDIAR